MQCEKNGDTLIIKVKLGKPRPSSTGRTNIVYTSGGFVPIGEDGMKINLTITIPRNQ